MPISFRLHIHVVLSILRVSIVLSSPYFDHAHRCRRRISSSEGERGGIDLLFVELLFLCFKEKKPQEEHLLIVTMLGETRRQTSHELCRQRKCIVNICTYRAISADQFETCYTIGIETKFNVDDGKLWRMERVRADFAN